MEVIVLQSGSAGNCVYVEADGVKLLFDAGISGRQAEQRLAAHGRDIRQVDALIISHDHRDHVSCMGVFHRKFGLPIYITPPTLDVTRRRLQAGRLGDVNHFNAGDALHFGGLRVETLPTPHDAADGVAFIIDNGHQRLGILTDLGHVYSELRDAVATLDGVLLESNYDQRMLETGPYAPYLQERIRGPRGHLSNLEAAELISQAGSSRLQWVCLGHLSEENNEPGLAIRTHREVLGDRLPLSCANRRQASAPLRLAAVSVA